MADSRVAPSLGVMTTRIARLQSRALIEVRCALSFSKECQSLWLYLPINRDNHHASIPAQGIIMNHGRCL